MFYFPCHIVVGPKVGSYDSNLLAFMCGFHHCSESVAAREQMHVQHACAPLRLVCIWFTQQHPSEYCSKSSGCTVQVITSVVKCRQLCSLQAILLNDACRYNSSSRTADFSLLDRNNGAGWDLACKLVRQRNQFRRGRLSARQALRHRFFWTD